MFTIDSTLFDYGIVDTLQIISLPHLKDWNISQNPANFSLVSPDTTIRMELKSLPLRKPNSFKFYSDIQNIHALGMQLLDISTFKKDGSKVIQVILRNDSDFNFKLIEDIDGNSKEVNIFINHADYIEENIRIIESIIGSMKFI